MELVPGCHRILLNILKDSKTIAIKNGKFESTFRKTVREKSKPFLHSITRKIVIFSIFTLSDKMILGHKPTIFECIHLSTQFFRHLVVEIIKNAAFKECL